MSALTCEDCARLEMSTTQSKLRGAKASMQYICALLAETGVEDIQAEDFRRAKFDEPGVAPTLWKALHSVLLLERAGILASGHPQGDVAASLRALRHVWGIIESEAGYDAAVDFVLDALDAGGYPDQCVFQMTWDASSARRLLLALGWLLGRTRLLERAHAARQHACRQQMVAAARTNATDTSKTARTSAAGGAHPSGPTGTRQGDTSTGAAATASSHAARSSDSDGGGTPWWRSPLPYPQDTLQTPEAMDVWRAAWAEAEHQARGSSSGGGGGGGGGVMEETRRGAASARGRRGGQGVGGGEGYQWSQVHEVMDRALHLHGKLQVELRALLSAATACHRMTHQLYSDQLTVGGTTMSGGKDALYSPYELHLLLHPQGLKERQRLLALESEMLRQEREGDQHLRTFWRWLETVLQQAAAENTAICASMTQDSEGNGNGASSEPPEWARGLRWAHVAAGGWDPTAQVTASRPPSATVQPWQASAGVEVEEGAGLSMERRMRALEERQVAIGAEMRHAKDNLLRLTAEWGLMRQQPMEGGGALQALAMDAMERFPDMARQRGRLLERAATAGSKDDCVRVSTAAAKNGLPSTAALPADIAQQLAAAGIPSNGPTLPMKKGLAESLRAKDDTWKHIFSPAPPPDKGSLADHPHGTPGMPGEAGLRSQATAGGASSHARVASKAGRATVTLSPYLQPLRGDPKARPLPKSPWDSGDVTEPSASTPSDTPIATAATTEAKAPPAPRAEVLQTVGADWCQGVGPLFRGSRLPKGYARACVTATASELAASLREVVRTGEEALAANREQNRLALKKLLAATAARDDVLIVGL
eukprot:jgi/Mesvir1/13370/Mv05853-RA.1